MVTAPKWPPLLVAWALASLACAAPRTVSTAAAPTPGSIVDARTRTLLGPAQLASRLGDADVVVFGEAHGDTTVHRIQAELLAWAATLRRPIVVSLEMFERDVQQLLDSYLAATVSEEVFLAGARPWPRYATDYRPLVETARAYGWPVIAANVPRPIAALVSRAGLPVLDSIRRESPWLVPATVNCPPDAYRERFLASMRAHPAPAGAPTDTLPTAVAERFYLAQCVKDEAMAEAIVQASRIAPPGGLVLHFTGAFHSDFRQGTVERVLRRDPGLRVLVISTVQTSFLAPAGRESLALRADYLVLARER